MPKITILNFLSLVKFSHTIFAFPFAIVGYFTAIKLTGHNFDLILFAKVILCMILRAMQPWLSTDMQTETLIREILELL